MSTKLGTLTLDLIAKIGGFTGPIRDAERQTQSSFDKMRKHVNTYGTMAVASAAAVGAGILAMANEYANAARELQTFASISNTTTQEFQRMAVGAETMGISSEKLSDQLKDFNEKLGEFITIGSGGAVDFFEQIAIKTEGSAEAARKLALEMQNLSGPKALQLYVDKLEEAGVTQQQMSFYLESMASDTTNLIPLLRDGGKGFEYWADAAERAGVIMDEHAIEKANELRVQMDLLNLQLQGVKNQFIQGLMPALVSVGDGLSDATLQTNLMSDAGETLGEVFKGVAATGMGVYAVVKMLSNSIAGLAAQAVQSKQMVDKAAEGRGVLANLPGVKALKALTLGVANARTNPDSAVQMAVQDNAQVAEDVANSINRIYNDAVNQSVSAMAKIQNSQAGVTKGSDEWIKKQNEAAKATKENNKAQQELNRLLEEQARARDSISYDYMDDFAKFSVDLKRELEEIQKANFGSQESEYLAKAKARYEYEEEMYLRQITEEINTFKWSEEQKLDYFYETQRIIVSESGKYNDELKQLKLKALDEQYAIELQKARFHAQNVQQAMRESIKGLSYGVDEIFAQATMSPQDYDRWSLENDRSNAQLGLKNERVRVEQDIMTSDAYSTDDERYAALLEAHQEYRDAMAAIDVDYQQKTKDLEFQQYNEKMGMYSEMLSQASSIWGNMTQLVKDSQGEQSGAFKAMFLIQQGMAAAQAIIYANVASAAALAPPPIGLGPVAGAPLSSLIKINGYMSAGIIAGQTIAGMAHDGIDNIPKEGTWLLDKGERVVDSRTNADLKNMIANNDGGGPQININVPPGYTAEQSRGADGAVTIDIVEKRIKQSWGNLGNPNSYESKQVQRNTTAGVKR
ncbi:hypothetical protein [Acinetobacter pseudolwoffii]|uniref:Phage tail tape measure protein n=1 Tax=Acinetobacter pseudolwoffii TaxID=2053287 RepID=A0A2H9YS73_9GAMM|nr:hypothetical protein [Acinetobacter pseudolwoffii]PJO75500.1 hypothetical protein CWI32_08200 [Acinetobacter pseudolwoffii]